MFKPDKRLKTRYDKFNKLYWDGQLPSETIVGWDDGLADDTDGETLILEHESGEKVFLIHLSVQRVIDRQERDRVLLHEMGHVKLYPFMKHGRRHDEEMLRIASRGAFDGIW
jgi:hypothetical protein